MTRRNAVRMAGMALLCFCMAGFCSPALADFPAGPSVNYQAAVVFPANGQYIFGGTFVLSSPNTPTIGANFDLIPPGAEVPVPLPDGLPGILTFVVGAAINLTTIPPNNNAYPFGEDGGKILVNPPIVDPGTGIETVQTQLLQLDMSGGSLPAGVDVRLSPTIPSTGTTTFAPNPGGGFMINSFFDIFTELSLDGGQTWTPATGPSQAVLVPLPEPSSVLLLGVGMALVLFARLRRGTS